MRIKLLPKKRHKLGLTGYAQRSTKTRDIAKIFSLLLFGLVMALLTGIYK